MIRILPFPASKTVKLRAVDAEVALRTFDERVLSDPRAWDWKTARIVQLLAKKALLQMLSRDEGVDISSTELKNTLGQRTYLSHWTRMVTSLKQGHSSFEATHSGAPVEAKLSSYDALGYLMRVMGWARSQTKAIYLATVAIIQESLAELNLKTAWFSAFLLKRFTWLRNVTTVMTSTISTVLSLSSSSDPGRAREKISEWSRQCRLSGRLPAISLIY